MSGWIKKILATVALVATIFKLSHQAKRHLRHVTRKKEKATPSSKEETSQINSEGG